MVKAADGAGNYGTPNQRVVQRNNGGCSDRSVVAVNGDLFYQALTPSINSLFTALRYFNQWGNKPISANIDRALRFNNRGLMVYSTGIEFDNYLLNGILARTTTARGGSQGDCATGFRPDCHSWVRIHPLHGLVFGKAWTFSRYSTATSEVRERAFAVTVSRDRQSIQLWELTNDTRFENGDERVSWHVETPAWTWGREFDLKWLDGGEIWLDRIYGTVDGMVEYRVDGNPCWQFWHAFRDCKARNSCEDTVDPVCYPQQEYAEGDKFPVTLPKPPTPPCYENNHRPMTLGHQFQVQIQIKGWCRIRGIIVYALPYVKQPFEAWKLHRDRLPRFSSQP